MDRETIQQISDRLSKRRNALLAFDRDLFANKGIVICAGGPRMFTNAYVLIHVLRHHLGCLLPIEVWHLGPMEMSPRMSGLLNELRAHPVDAHAVMARRPPRLLNAWQLKPYAIMWSRFEEVLYLDADQIPVRDPAEVFSWPQFRATGMVLWPDIIDIPVANQIWEVCGLPPRRMISIESGQLLFDKHKVWRSLDMTLALNEEAYHLYQAIYGDKDTYLLAAMMCGQEFSMVPFRPRTDVPWCFYQTDFSGIVLFQHRSGAKWRFTGEQRRLPQFQHVEACESALAELRRKWNGRVFSVPSVKRTKDDEGSQQLIGKTFRLVRPGMEEVVLGFLPDGEVATETDTDPMNWYCDSSKEPAAVILCCGSEADYHFSRSDGDVWRAGSILLLPNEVPGRQSCRYLVRELLAAAGYPSSAALSNLAELEAGLLLLSRRHAGVKEELLSVLAEQAPGQVADILEKLVPSLGASGEPCTVKVRQSSATVIEDHYTSSTAK